MLRGDTVYLCALDHANAEQARAWINDPDVNEWMLSGHIPLTAAEEAEFYARMDASPADHVFEIHVAADDRYIGNCGLNSVDLIHRHAELGIVIGELAEQNRGRGRDAILTLLRYGFETLGLNSVEIRLVAGNERAAHLYPSLGFKPAGVLREHLFLRGAYRDEIVLDMLAGEWRALTA